MDHYRPLAAKDRWRLIAATVFGLGVLGWILIDMEPSIERLGLGFTWVLLAYFCTRKYFWMERIEPQPDTDRELPQSEP